MAILRMKPKRWSQTVLVFILSSALCLCEAAKEQESSIDGDLLVASSIAVNTYKLQSAASASSGQKYGYPFLIAPTLTPTINSRSDDDEDFDQSVPIALAQNYGSELTVAATGEKKLNEKKKKPYSYGANRRQESVEGISEYKLRKYKEPKYRNFDELENKFKPRIDYDATYSGYYVPKLSKPKVSQRDPYLSPSKQPVDSFYPVPKSRSYSSPYKQSYRDSAVYGAGHYEDPEPYYGTYGQGDYPEDTYDGPSKYPANEEPYNYQEDYTIESNKPIIGDIRKRLLDYAGASDLYEGEPDYLRQVSVNKNKYGYISNDYFAYGGPEYKNSYRGFPYVESKVSLIKKRRAS